MSKFSKQWLFARSRRDKARPSVKSGACVALGLMVAAGTLMAPVQANAASSLKVETQEGPVQGFVKNGVREFLGIPYAAPPVGNLRWMPPRNPAPWTKVLQATGFGPTCAQITELGVFAGPANNNADCLFLNVFSPNVNSAARTKLPVIFWIHGGGNVDGESNDYDASKLAAQGHTVVVTINYRLGLLGFFANPAIDKEGHLFGNYGTLDQQFALKWVQNNIAAFGGDKNNVTVGGQSAGSANTEANVISPLSKGLFNRAIFESLVIEPVTLATAETKGTAFSVAAGCGSRATPTVAACLRNLTVAQIMSLQGTASADGPFVISPGGLLQDGHILPSSTFASAIQVGRFNHMPIMSGSAEDEENFTLGIEEFFESPRVPFTAANYSAMIASFTGSELVSAEGDGTFPLGTPAAVQAHYPLNAFPTPQLAMDRIGTDPEVCQQRAINKLFATQVPVYAYEFDDRTAPSYLPAMPGYVPLAYHTGDIQYLFPLYHGGPQGIVHQLNRQQENLSDELVAAWTNFAWTSNPNGQGNMPWPLYKPNKPNVASILSENSPVLTTFSDAEFSAAHQCNFWDSVLTF
jgi:para-nitrobenzyl esterase